MEMITKILKEILEYNWNNVFKVNEFYSFATMHIFVIVLANQDLNVDYNVYLKPCIYVSSFFR